MSIPCHDGSLFTWNGNVGTIEASALGLTRCFSTFQVKSPKTSHTLTFKLVSVERDRENEVTGWVYVAEEKDVRIHIFND